MEGRRNISSPLLPRRGPSTLGQCSDMTPVTEIWSQRWEGNSQHSYPPALEGQPASWNRKAATRKQEFPHGSLKGCVPGSAHWCFASLGLTQEVGRAQGKGIRIFESLLSPWPLERLLENVSFVIRELALNIYKILGCVGYQRGWPQYKAFQ